MHRPDLPTFLVATRNEHKLREISDLLDGAPVRLVSLTDIGVEVLPGEEDVEAFETFEENALAKARFYRSHTDMAVVADDSGICVDALGGEPGVRSRRFAPPGEWGDGGQDAANNLYLLDRLRSVPDDRRGAHYRCALVLVSESRTLVLGGRVHGSIAREPSGDGGFGYDPLFLVPSYGRTFGDLDPEVKASISHRAEATRSFRRWLVSNPFTERESL